MRISFGAPSDPLEPLKIFAGGTGGIDSWLGPDTAAEVLDRLRAIPQEPLPLAQLNQLLVLSHEAGMTTGFFQYYWGSAPQHHPYDVAKVEGYSDAAIDSTAISSIRHLAWGMRRLYIDGLLYFGNIRTAYRNLRTKSASELAGFFGRYRHSREALTSRGPHLPLDSFAKDDRYLVSEMACKSYDAADGTSELEKILNEAFAEHLRSGGGKVSVRELLDGTYTRNRYGDLQIQLQFSADDILDADVNSADDLRRHYERVSHKFLKARSAALANTRIYLSMVGDLDVYVATSMRTREDFRKVADTCDTIFRDPRLDAINIRYFDPTLSAAEGHEDKGLIECLMVKAAKALVYLAGSKESYGKDAEAAMALSLGKPVIFLCDEEQRSRFYRDVHPLARLIDFRSGVAVGAMVTSDLSEVSELLVRTFDNDMQYELCHPKPGYYRLKERLTGSVVRLQTSDPLLRETFWNYYDRDLGPTRGNTAGST